jgi:hypothetical protein
MTTLYLEGFWVKRRELSSADGPAKNELFEELLLQAQSMLFVRERMRGLESLYEAGMWRTHVIQELLEIQSLSTRRRAELTLELAQRLSDGESGGIIWAERVAAAQDALALARRLRDRQMVKLAKRILKSYRSGYTPRRHDKPLRW